MKFALVVVAIALLSRQALSQGDGEGEENGAKSWWNRLKATVKEFVNSLQDLWNQVKEEVKSRTVDIRSWTQEMMDGFKHSMNDMINGMKGASEKEKEDMRNYIEKLEMPPENNNNN